MCLTKSTRVRQLIVKQTGCLPFVQVAPKCLPFAQDTTKQRYLSRKATIRAITYKKILNKSNVILAACLHLLATFGLECRAFACEKSTICKKVGGLSKVGGGASAPPPCPSSSAAYVHSRRSSLLFLYLIASGCERDLSAPVVVKGEWDE